mgnify:CR=1 FL=1
MGLIEVRNLSFSHGETKVLHDISFSIQEKDLVTIVGPNGGGKTTLLLLLLGLLQPEKGSIRIKGKKPEAVQRIMGYVPQYSLFDPHFPVTVFDVVLMGCMRKAFGFYSKNDYLAVEEVLSSLSLYDLRNRSFTALSGGQRQRVLIARALVSHPEILLLDEPTANVDARVGDHLNVLLQKLNKELTILLVTHDTAFVSKFTSRVFCINRSFAEHPSVQLEGSPFPSILYGTEVAAVQHSIHLPETQAGVTERDTAK